jgi:hypothetical protein
VAAVERLAAKIERATVPAAAPHTAMLRAGLAALADRQDETVAHLRGALEGYSRAEMAMHREVARSSLGSLIGGDEGQSHRAQATSWMKAEVVPEMEPLKRALAPGLA